MEIQEEEQVQRAPDNRMGEAQQLLAEGAVQIIMVLLETVVLPFGVVVVEEEV